MVLGVDDSLLAVQTLGGPIPRACCWRRPLGLPDRARQSTGRAARSGLREGDRILEIDGRAISPPQLKTLAALVDGTSPAYIVVWRAGHRIGHLPGMNELTSLGVILLFALFAGHLVKFARVPEITGYLWDRRRPVRHGMAVARQPGLVERV